MSSRLSAAPGVHPQRRGSTLGRQPGVPASCPALSPPWPAVSPVPGSTPPVRRSAARAWGGQVVHGVWSQRRPTRRVPWGRREKRRTPPSRIRSALHRSARRAERRPLTTGLRRTVQFRIFAVHDSLHIHEARRTSATFRVRLTSKRSRSDQCRRAEPTAPEA